MANKGIIFYGKPQSFERYELVGNQISIDERNEPRLKPLSDSNDILHYFFQDDYYYLELFGYANPYNAVRDGVVIGVCIKSDKQIVVSKNNISKLKSLLTQFKETALLETKFKALKLIDIGSFRKTIQEADVESFVSNFKTRDVKEPTQKKLTLLYLKDFENRIDDVLMNEISDYSDIYVSADKNVFSDNLNRVLINEVNENIYIVENGKIIPMLSQQKHKPLPTPPLPTPPLPTPSIPDNSSIIKLLILMKKWLIISVCTSAASLILIIAFFFGTSSPLDKWKTDNFNRQFSEKDKSEYNTTPTTDGRETQTVTEDHANQTAGSNSNMADSRDDGSSMAQISAPKITFYTITAKLKLGEKIVKIEGATLSEITFRITPENMATIATTNGFMTVNQDARKKLKENTQITVEAFWGDESLGSQTYTIAKP